MSRLTKKFDDEYGSADCYHSCFDCYWNGCDSVTLMVNKLAHYEDLEEQGRLKKLPCAVGDILYDLNKEFVVREISLWEDDCDLYALNIKIEDWKENFEMITSEDIGETVFLTKEAAEAKLAEVKGK